MSTAGMVISRDAVVRVRDRMRARAEFFRRAAKTEQTNSYSKGLDVGHVMACDEFADELDRLLGEDTGRDGGAS